MSETKVCYNCSNETSVYDSTCSTCFAAHDAMPRPTEKDKTDSQLPTENIDLLTGELLKPADSIVEDSLESFLTNAGFSKYLKLFEENNVDVDLLSELDEADLTELGITALGDRKKLMLAINNRQQLTQKPKKAPSKKWDSFGAADSTSLWDVTSDDGMSNRVRLGQAALSDGWSDNFDPFNMMTVGGSALLLGTLLPLFNIPLLGSVSLFTLIQTGFERGDVGLGVLAPITGVLICIDGSLRVGGKSRWIVLISAVVMVAAIGFITMRTLENTPQDYSAGASQIFKFVGIGFWCLVIGPVVALIGAIRDMSSPKWST